MPLVATRGAASAQGFGEFAVTSTPTYIEDVFSCFLYTGTGASQTITNGIDLSTKGGLTWIKGRSGTTGHRLTDTARGATKSLASETTAAEATESTGLTAFGTTGFTIGADADYNTSAATYVSWTFRKQPKFFDVVTYTGTGSNTTIAHNLGAVPGSIIVKRTNTTAAWAVYHRSLANTQYLVLNTTAAAATGATWWNSTTPTSSVFSVGTDASVNASGGTYVAYLFANDAGGFGLTGTDNVITCGSFTTDGSGNASVNLGYEPQFWLYKPNLAARYWTIYDVMRGWSQTYIANLNPNVTDAEGGGAATLFYPTATGFDCVGSALDANTQHIYIAIRRGPMKVPTDATKVFKPVTYTGSPGNQSITGVGFPPDLFMANWRASVKGNFEDRLRGTDPYLQSTTTGAEATGSTNIVSYDMSGITLGVNNLNNKDGASFIGYFYQRAPSFFDEVCYSGTGAVGNAISHNLGVAPELAIFKGRTGTVGASNWSVFTQFTGTNYVRAFLQTTDAGTTYLYTNNAGIASAPTSTTITVDNVANLNNGSTTYVAYLFATCAGVSKVGTYTGNGTTQTINCGFTGGARFVLIKATSTTGDWLTFDTARGMTVLTDPVLSLNSTAAETATLGACTTVATGFAVNEAIFAGVNTTGVSYIFLSVA